MSKVDWVPRKINAVHVRLHRKRAAAVFDAMVSRSTSDIPLRGLTREQEAIVRFVLERRLDLQRNIIPSGGDLTVSVVIPHYNHASYLGESLEGLARQTVRPDEVVIVDDCSSDVDEVKKVVGEYSSALNITPLYSQTKLYAGGARQRGAEAAGGRIIAMHDADDISHPQRIEFTLRFFRDHPSAAQLNPGHVPIAGRTLTYVRDFSEEEYASSIIGPGAIAEALRSLYVWNRFSQDPFPDMHQGAYGCSARFGCHAGHVAYRKTLVTAVPWVGRGQHLVTKYEDLEFNVLLFLVTLESYQLDLPLIYYRAGTTTNVL